MHLFLHAADVSCRVMTLPHILAKAVPPLSGNNEPVNGFGQWSRRRGQSTHLCEVFLHATCAAVALVHLLVVPHHTFSVRARSVVRWYLSLAVAHPGS